VPGNVGIGRVFNNGRITGSSILWQYALPVSASATFSYTVTLPQTASSYTFTTGVWYANAGQGQALPLQEYGVYPFTVTVTIESKTLLKEIISDVEDLTVDKQDYEHKEKVLNILNKLQSNAGEELDSRCHGNDRGGDECHDPIKDILKAIDELMEIKSADITLEIIQIRLNLDVEVRMYELMSSEID
jgi:hypothetical protein